MATSSRQKHNTTCPPHSSCYYRYSYSSILCKREKNKAGKSDLQLNFYAQSCPNAEEIFKKEVIQLYNKQGNTAVSWVRNSPMIVELRQIVNNIKEALEKECLMTVSCADIVALSAGDGIVMLGGPRIAVKTGRRGSRESYLPEVEIELPNHNDSVSCILSSSQSIGIDTEGTVALLEHSVGRVHCVNIVHRLYPTVDPTLDPDYAEYLKGRGPTPDPEPKATLYARNDLETLMILDNSYHKTLLKQKGLLQVDQELASDPVTSPFVEKMASDNGNFQDQFARAILLLSENNPLTGDQG